MPPTVLAGAGELATDGGTEGVDAAGHALADRAVEGDAAHGERAGASHHDAVRVQRLGQLVRHGAAGADQDGRLDAIALGFTAAGYSSGGRH